MKLEDAGNALSDILRQYMSDMGVEDGLQALGYSSEDIPALVKGTIPQVYTVTSLTHFVLQCKMFAGYNTNTQSKCM